MRDDSAGCDDRRSQVGTLGPTRGSDDNAGSVSKRQGLTEFQVKGGKQRPEPQETECQHSELKGAQAF